MSEDVKTAGVLTYSRKTDTATRPISLVTNATQVAALFTSANGVWITKANCEQPSNRLINNKLNSATDSVEVALSTPLTFAN